MLLRGGPISNVSSGSEAPENSERWRGSDSTLVRFILRESEARLEGYRLNPGDIEEHAAIEQSVIDGGYGHRQLFELIQNAADAIRAANTTGRVEIRLTPEALYVAKRGPPGRRGGRGLNPPLAPLHQTEP